MFDSIDESFPCREKEVVQLRSLISPVGELLPESIFIHGQPSVGKTSVTCAFLNSVNAQSAYVNCLECYTIRLLLEPIVSTLIPCDKPVRCDTYLDLVHQLKAAQKLGIFNESSIVVVLDGVEHLAKVDDYCINFFGRLQELTSIYNMTVIFIGRVAPEKFNIIPTVVLHFPQYTKDELMKIFKLYKPSDIDEELYNAYIASAVAVFLRTTRDLVEMKNLILKNVRKYVAPVERGEVTSKDILQLWRLVAPHLRESLNSAYLGITHEDDSTRTSNNTELITHKKLRVFDLPYYAKYFLIAGYLASYNSPKYDRRLFMKNHGKQRKTLRKAVNKNKDMQMLGPKTFSLDRLLAIFYAIMESKASLTVNLMSQIATLVELRLFAKMGDGSIDNPKFKCLANFDCVSSVADTLCFCLPKYLLD